MFKPWFQGKILAALRKTRRAHDGEVWRDDSLEEEDSSEQSSERRSRLPPLEPGTHLGDAQRGCVDGLVSEGGTTRPDL